MNRHGQTHGMPDVRFRAGQMSCRTRQMSRKREMMRLELLVAPLRYMVTRVRKPYGSRSCQSLGGSAHTRVRALVTAGAEGASP